MTSITIPVTELQPGDQFVTDGLAAWTVVEKPQRFSHPDMSSTGTSAFVKFHDGGYGTRVWDKGATITVERPRDLHPGLEVPDGLEVKIERPDDDYHQPEFPYVILDADGVVDRVATETEAKSYVALGETGLRWEKSEPTA